MDVGRVQIHGLVVNMHMFGDWHSVVQEIRSALLFKNGKDARKAGKESETISYSPMK